MIIVVFSRSGNGVSLDRAHIQSKVRRVGGSSRGFARGALVCWTTFWLAETSHHTNFDSKHRHGHNRLTGWRRTLDAWVSTFACGADQVIRNPSTRVHEYSGIGIGIPGRSPTYTGGHVFQAETERESKRRLENRC